MKKILNKCKKHLSYISNKKKTAHSLQWYAWHIRTFTVCTVLWQMLYIYIYILGELRNAGNHAMPCVCIVIYVPLRLQVMFIISSSALSVQCTKQTILCLSSWNGSISTVHVCVVMHSAQKSTSLKTSEIGPIWPWTGPEQKQELDRFEFELRSMC